MSAESTKPEFAEQYTKAEAIRIVVFGTIGGAVLILLGKAWLFPAIGAFANTAHCRTVFGFDGVAVLWYGMFVGLPLHVAVLVLATFGWRGFKILRGGQFPPHGEKVGHPTRIRRGQAAQLIGYLHLIVCIPLFALTLWGYFQAEQLVHRPIPASAFKACGAMGKSARADPALEGSGQRYALASLASLTVPERHARHHLTCSTCNAKHTATTVRGVQSGTSLIHAAVGYARSRNRLARSATTPSDLYLRRFS